METKQLAPHRILPLANARGAAKDRTNDFLTTKSKINLYKDPSKR